MGERVIQCDDATRWKVMAPGRSSYHRIELVFESLDAPGTLLRGEAPATKLSELSDTELCFVLGELRSQE